MKRKGIKRSLLSVALAAGLGSALALETNEDISILQGLQEDENFTTLVSLLESTGLAEDLGAAGDVTLFAPTNEAFENLGEEQLTALSKDSETLTGVLQLHVLPGEYPVLDLAKAEERTLSNLAGEPYIIEQSAGGLMVNDADLVSTDVDNFYSNGVVHVVSNVLVSASMAMQEDAMTPTTDMNGDGVIDDADMMTDTNGDGVIDDADMMTDTNGDGVIDEADMAVTDDATNTETGTTTITLTDTNNDGVVDGNDVADSNNDGVVDEQDYTAAGVTDTNNDGVIDEQDIITIDTATTDTTTQEETTAQDTTTEQDMTGTTEGSMDFASFDTDGDGSVSQEEFSQGFFARLDTDGDGFLSDSEWSAASFMSGDDNTTLTQ
jgi:uncharacterized surface protein with fasciclin (FAS1) repeats